MAWWRFGHDVLLIENGTAALAEACGVQVQYQSDAAIIEIDQKSDMRACKQAALGKATLLGPIDPSEIMANGAPAQVTERCREALEIMAPGGGFILGPGCALPATTPDENIDALIESAKEHGSYH